MNYLEIQDFVKAIAKSGASEVCIESDGMKITIKTQSKGKVETVVQQVAMPVQMPVMAAAPVIPAMAAAPATAEPVKANADEESKYITIKAPMVGTFYRKSAPEKPVFVNVDDVIAPGKVICILEAMKLFNEIESEVSGRIVKVLVDDASPVEYDQPLFLVDPS